MNLNEKKFITLEQVLGCYFHQDWIDEFNNDSDAINAIIREESNERLELCISEINVLLSGLYTDDELKNIVVNNIGCYFYPETNGLSYTTWLLKVRSAFTRTS